MTRSSSTSDSSGRQCVAAAIAFSGATLGLAVSATGAGGNSDFGFVVCFLLTAFLLLLFLRTLTGSIRPAAVMAWLLPEDQSPDRSE